MTNNLDHLVAHFETLGAKKWIDGVRGPVVRGGVRMAFVRRGEWRFDTYASHLAERVSLPIVGAVLGHVDPKTTVRYAHIDTEGLAREASAK